MTDAAPRARRAATGSAAALTWLGALVVFAVVLILLAWRMLDGGDPVLGAGTPAQSAAAMPARHVIVRRVIKRTIVVDEPPATGAPAAAGGNATTSAAPVRVATAPAPNAPTPAPAPVTRAS